MHDAKVNLHEQSSNVDFRSLCGVEDSHPMELSLKFALKRPLHVGCLQLHVQQRRALCYAGATSLLGVSIADDQAGQNVPRTVGFRFHQKCLTVRANLLSASASQLLELASLL